MMQRTTTSTNKAVGGLLAAIAASGVLSATALGSAPAANATCASFFGIGNSAHCTSSPTSIAIAVGTDSTARALGLFGTALVIGNVGLASIPAVGAFNVAMELGYNGESFASGVSSLSLASGSNGEADAGTSKGFTQFGNIALDLGAHSFPPNTDTLAAGVGNLAVNIGAGLTNVEAVGYFNIAENLMGSNSVESGTNLKHGVAGLALGLLSDNTTVTAGPGPFAIAEAFAITGVTVTKKGPGFNINGFKVGGAAAPQPAAVHTAPHLTTTAKAAVAVTHKPHVSPAATKRSGAK